jgi:FkbM family methyltransferase
MHKISLHHIGGRSGSRSFPVLSQFELDFIVALYDADESCLDQIKSANKRLKSELHVLPYCVSGSNGLSDFNITYDPYTSSLLEPNAKYASFYSEVYGIDYIISDTFRIERKVKLNSFTLDTILYEKELSIQKPDVLSLDVQGAEYDILESAEKTLSTALCVILEVEFLPLYENQKLFGDICNLLTKHGFIFCNFMHLDKNSSPYRNSIGLRSGGFSLFADALFIKAIDHVNNDKDNVSKYAALRKLAFISIALNMFEFGLHALKESNSIGIDKTKYNDTSIYNTFLDKLDKAVKEHPRRYLPTFIEKYPSFEDSNARFNSSNLIPESFYSRLKIQIEKYYPELVLSLWKKKLWLTNFLIELPYRLRNTPVEKLLMTYRLYGQAQTIKKIRVSQSKFMPKRHP